MRSITTHLMVSKKRRPTCPYFIFAFLKDKIWVLWSVNQSQWTRLSTKQGLFLIQLLVFCIYLTNFVATFEWYCRWFSNPVSEVLILESCKRYSPYILAINFWLISCKNGKICSIIPDLIILSDWYLHYLFFFTSIIISTITVKDRMCWGSKILILPKSNHFCLNFPKSDQNCPNPINFAQKIFTTGRRLHFLHPQLLRHLIFRQFQHHFSVKTATIFLSSLGYKTRPHCSRVHQVI